MHHNERLRDIVAFWFIEENKPFWFLKDKKFDQIIRNKFFPSYEFFLDHDPLQFCDKPENYLALIILYDQFPRNMFRDDAKAFATDAKALNLAKQAIEQGIDKKCTEEQRRFIYMPFMHSEVLEDQKQSLELFKSDTNSYDYAKAHFDIIKEFKRFPHRNKILSRPSTESEKQFLTQPNSSF